MTSLKSQFKYIDRGFGDLLVLIPGWATDYKIFLNLNLNYNYLLPTKLYPFDFTKALLNELKKMHIEKISLFGWSLGGFLAAEFASINYKMINEVILLGICKKFDSSSLKSIKLSLKKNKRAFLYKFYHDCFSKDDSEAFAWFRKNLLKEYIDKIKIEDLISGLNYLMKAEIMPQSLANLHKVRILHGAKDKIVPFKEAIALKSEITHAEFICLEHTGHMLFLDQQFKGRFHNG